ncbi:hypothetical protein ACN42_g9509 [Penicillium freii]|uniref:Ketoreductase (KR) domain-containing protein n=1 Tax=Penicillium freii TaxID=48697 RepID=A0A101MBT2_PENFR|nr:hypothetical protein ACN42_g9509 [Penicillium freii]
MCWRLCLHFLTESGLVRCLCGYFRQVECEKTVAWPIRAHNGVRALNLGCKQLTSEPDLHADIRWPKKQYVKPRGYKIFLSPRFSTCQLPYLSTYMQTIDTMQEYTYAGPIDCSKPINVENLKGKTAIVTGGANGLGEAYVRALVAVGYETMSEKRSVI